MYNEVPITDKKPSSRWLGKSTFNWYIYYCSFAAIWLTIAGTVSLIWISPMISILQSNDPNINPLGKPISTIHLSVLTSVSFLSPLLTTPTIGKISDKFGRKNSMIFSATLTALSYLTIAFVPNFYIYCICRLITGVAKDYILVNCSIYSNEITEPSKRGRFGLYFTLAYPLGYLYGYVIGAYAAFRLFNILCSLPAVVHLLLCAFITDSPVALALKGKRTKALRALEKLRDSGQEKDLELELSAILREVKSKAENSSFQLKNLWNNAASRKALLLGLVVTFSEKCCGINFVLPFSADCFNRLNLSGNTVNILIAVIQFFGFLFSACIVNKVGKKRLMISSMIVCILSMLSMGCYLFLHSKQIVSSNLDWLSVVCVLVFMTGYSTGLGCVELSILCELFPTQFRALGVTLAVTAGVLISFISLFAFPIVRERFGEYPVLWFYGLINSVFLIIVYFKLPETTGKSFEKIQNLLEENK
ncbi:unnamed protein product [Phyllotreta striolata]|uniref:Major facilitator superfamily (MFS) profile domain-containing protein n=1 Tax=Phyllotreta striolata TaxID=444603 RepID=A0A9N9XS36_PHYSR|nr:unnamed protein product [Phyllotreta striolata]